MPNLKGYKNYCVKDIAYICTFKKEFDEDPDKPECEHREKDPRDSFKKCRHHFDGNVCRSDKAQDECNK